MRTYLAIGYAMLVVALGAYNTFVLLTVADPILITGVLQMVITCPLGVIVWFLWSPIGADRMLGPIGLIVALTLAGLVQSWILWVVGSRRRSRR